MSREGATLDCEGEPLAAEAVPAVQSGTSGRSMTRPPPDPGTPRRGRRTRGVSLVEILMGTGILAAALVPIGWYFVSSARQQANLKAEASAAAYAGKVMNRILDEIPFDDLASGLGETVEIDGTTIQWSAEVVDLGDFEFKYPVGTGEESAPLSTLDAKFRDQGWVKDVIVTFQWKGPRDDTLADPRRTQTLVTRRARL